MKRREFLGISALTAAAGLGLAGATCSFTTGEVELNEYDVPLKEIPTEFNGFRIGVLSDIHFGPAVLEQWLSEATQLLNKANIDLCLFGGDHIYVPSSFVATSFPYYRNKEYDNLHGAKKAQAIFETVAKYISTINATYGLFATYGNHDRWTAPADCSEIFSKQGVSFLVNHERVIMHKGARLRLFGTDDYWTGVPRSPGYNHKEFRDELRVVLSHNPDYLSELTKQQEPFHLGVAGHTHGGQIKLPGIGALFYNVRDTDFAEGLVRRSLANGNEATVFVSRGLGTVEIPYRLNCPPEVAVLELRSA